MPSTDLEQHLLELVNDARLDPMGNAARYISSYSPLTSPIADIQSAFNFFGVNGPALLSAFQALTPAEPLAWSDPLATAARNHSNAMIAANLQSHQLPGEPDPGTRMANAGYAPAGTFAWAENIFAASTSTLQEHAAFMVDWGPGPNGMQNPPGHRTTIMSPDYREVGIGLVQAPVQSNTGPFTVTQDFGSRGASGVFLLGVARNDTDGNAFYTPGEGLATLNIGITGGGSTTSSSSGGYALQTSLTGARTITLTGAGLASQVTIAANLVSGHNYKIDVIDGTALHTTLSGIISGPVTTVRGLGLTGLTLTTGTGAQLLFGSKGNDTLNAGADGDFLDGGLGGDALDGGAGFDLASWLSQTSGLTLNLANQGLNAGAAAGDTVANMEALYLTNSADTFTAGATGMFVYGFGGTDTLTGSSLSDFIDGGAGGDTINAGGGFDYVSYNSSSGAVTLNLQTPASNTGAAAGDAISNADAYILTEFGDTFIGLAGGQNIVFGYGGNDTLTGGLNTNNWFFGGEGNDRMVGGLWSDLYVGDNGADTLVPVTPTPLAGSSVFGFSPGVDSIELSRSAFGLSAGYAVANGTTFRSGIAPTNTVASPTFLYYTDSGLLYFDPDGTGATVATLLMQFAGAPALGAGDFDLV
jgi:uncharacterized protein YkwD